jgi:hypothetical protein
MIYKTKYISHRVYVLAEIRRNDSSISIATGYCVDEVPFAVGSRIYFLHSAQAGYGANQTSSPMDNGGLFLQG